MEAIIGLLTNETTTLHGRFVQLTDAMCNPKPVQQPHPPIVIGGAGERRTLRSVARYAQHWNFPGGTPEFFEQRRGVLTYGIITLSPRHGPEVLEPVAKALDHLRD